MKPETELKWVINLLNSHYLKGGYFNKQKSGCKKDFEEVAGASLNSRKFGIWIDYLIKIGALEFHEIRENNMSRPINTYIIIYNKLNELLIQNSLYEPMMKYVQKKNPIMLRSDRFL